jgi:hypothetical protein
MFGCSDVQAAVHFNKQIHRGIACAQIREAQLSQYNYILVVGEKEQEAGTVNVRTRDNQVHGEHKLEHVIEVMSNERSTRSLEGLFGEKSGSGDAGTPAEAPAANPAKVPAGEPANVANGNVQEA